MEMAAEVGMGEEVGAQTGTVEAMGMGLEMGPEVGAGMGDVKVALELRRLEAKARGMVARGLATLLGKVLAMAAEAGGAGLGAWAWAGPRLPPTPPLP